MAVKLALRGATVKDGEIWTDGLPYCDDPVRVGVRSDPRDAGRTLEVSMWAPCRKCAKCLQFRQMKWRERTINELVQAHDRGNRSWWMTLTFSPPHLAGILAEAVEAKGSTVETRVESAAYRHVQRYFKRLRKASKAKFRYLAVYERGEKTGRSHYHILLHEVGPVPVLKQTLEEQWRSNVHARLVHFDGRKVSGLATYISKYATKTLGVRPRASARYGRQPSRRAEEKASPQKRPNENQKQKQHAF